MTFKPNLSRQARLAAGARPPLPGQDPVREEELRIELSEEFKPEGRIELIWIEDIAYRVVTIEVIRAQIAGFRMREARTVHQEQLSADASAKDAKSRAEMIARLGGYELDDMVDLSQATDYSDAELERLAGYADRAFSAGALCNYLDEPVFGLLLGDMSREALAQLRKLQMYEHEEVRERDRIINQFERRRRQALRHAIELVEARRHAGLPEDLADPVLDTDLDTGTAITDDTSSHHADYDDAGAPALPVSDDEVE